MLQKGGEKCKEKGGNGEKMKGNERRNEKRKRKSKGRNKNKGKEFVGERKGNENVK